MNRFRLIGSGLLIWFVAGTANAAQTWLMPTPYGDGSFHTENIRWFANEVEKATAGEVKIEVHSGSSMFKMAEIKRALRTGQVQMAEFFLSAYGNEDPMYEADSVPFLAVGAEEARKLYELQKPFIEKRFAKERIISLYQVPWPGNGLYTKEAISHVSDLKGVRLRGQTPIIARLAELSGAVPVNIQLVDAPQAFSTGVVDGMFSAASNGIEFKMWEYTNHFHDLQAFHPKNVIAVNAGTWKSLSTDLRSKIQEVAKRAEERGWAKSIQLQDESPAALTANGMTVHTPTPELMAEFKKVGETMIAEWVERAGPEGADLVKKLGK